MIKKIILISLLIIIFSTWPALIGESRVWPVKEYSDTCGGGGSKPAGGGGDLNCPLYDLTPITETVAKLMDENPSERVRWQETNPQLEQDFFLLKYIIEDFYMGSVTATSAYRPYQYQKHLWEISNRWCTSQLDNPNSYNSQKCPKLRQIILDQKNNHFGVNKTCPIVVHEANSCAPHTLGIAVDINFGIITPEEADNIAANNHLYLRWANVPNDTPHWQLLGLPELCPPACNGCWEHGP